MPTLVNPAATPTNITLSQLAAATKPFRSYAGRFGTATGSAYSLNAATDGYFAPNETNASANSDQTSVRTVIGAAGTLKRFRVRFDSAPAATTTWTVAIQVNGVDVATATITDATAVPAEVAGTITTAAVAAEDDVCIRMSHNNGAARSTSGNWSFDVENA